MGGMLGSSWPDAGSQVTANSRSRGELDCSRLAAHFGGGGHRAAAGAFIDAALPEAQKKVLDEVRKAMQ